MATTPDPVNRFSGPASVEEFQTWFDADGRLVKESLMRQCLFEVGVDSSCQHTLWKFLFGIYPMNSTRRDQKAIDIENRANYFALRKRWEVLDKTIQIPDDEMVKNVPPYMEVGSEDEGEVEEEEKTNSPMATGNTVDAQTQPPNDSCPACNSRQNPDASKDLESQQTDQLHSEETDTAPSLINFSSPDRDVQSVGETTDMASSDTQCTCRPSATSVGCSSEVEGSSQQCQLPNESNRLCEHLNGRLAPVPPLQDIDAERSPKCGCKFRRKSGSDILDADGMALFNILDFPSKVYATRQPADLEKSYPKAKRVILRDVLRTDRNIHYFSHMRNLRKVHRILMIYAMFHPDVGYAQGMNDLLARFLVVTDSEVDSYWMFAKYMEYKREDFIEDTMMKKVALVKMLIMEVDVKLYNFFESSECSDYLFCHRWLLLDFKREFPFGDSLRLFEVISSHYLELNSDKALVETDKVIAKEFEHDKGEMRAGRSVVNLDFTFDLFVCVAILTMYSSEICKASDAASIYGTLNRLSMRMTLGEVLVQAEYLFYKYCKLSVTKGFNVLEI